MSSEIFRQSEVTQGVDGAGFPSIRPRRLRRTAHRRRQPQALDLARRLLGYMITHRR